LSAYWDPVACSAESGCSIAERRADEFFQAVNASIDAILQQYEELTGNVLIKDSNLAANALPISISVPEPVPRSELVRIIQSALLLNNYALIPGPEPNTVKVINMNAGKNPRNEGLPLYASPALPSRR
jgi:type II secretory pathway component GspD/PulD (secretin)